MYPFCTLTVLGLRKSQKSAQISEYFLVSLSVVGALALLAAALDFSHRIANGLLIVRIFGLGGGGGVILPRAQGRERRGRRAGLAPGPEAEKVAQDFHAVSL
jgi:hypothetical protein